MRFDKVHRRTVCKTITKSAWVIDELPSPVRPTVRIFVNKTHAFGSTLPPNLIRLTPTLTKNDYQMTYVELTALHIRGTTVTS